MKEYSALIIPHLSKELNLIGLPTLPYTLNKSGKTTSKNKKGEEALYIAFNSNEMIETLTFVCFELVKQIKALGNDENHVLDKLSFENAKQEKKLQLSKAEIQKKISELNAAKKENQQLLEKVNCLEKEIRDYKIEQRNLAKEKQTGDHIASLRTKKSHITESHRTNQKQSSLTNLNYFPRNFEFVQSNQPNFSKLWGKVKYSDAKTREEALKEAVCIFQTNNNALIEENFWLKTFLLTVLQQLHEIFELMVDKMHLPSTVLLNYKENDIFVDVMKFNFTMYKNILNENFKLIRTVCELFEEACFTVSDDLFVCWSDIMKYL